MTSTAWRRSTPVLDLFLALCAAASVLFAADTEDPLPDYRPKAQVDGDLSFLGSDTMNNLTTLWAEAFFKFQPKIGVEVLGRAVPSTYIDQDIRRMSFLPTSRELKPGEQERIEKALGHKATSLLAAFDTLAVYVHKDNPIEGLTFAQLDAIFSSTRKRGATADITTWGQVGLGGEWANVPITAYGRNSASLTYACFKKHALDGGDYKASVKAGAGSSSLVDAVAKDRGGIGYSGIGYKTAGVRAVPLAVEGARFVAPTAENGISGRYPLTRKLWLHTDHKPGTKLDALRAEFLRLVFSKQGQQVVVRDGYVPVTAAIARKELAKVGLKLE